MYTFWEILLFGLLLMMATMTITWLIQLKNKNAGLVDITWSYNFAFLAYLFFIFSEGFYDRKVLIASMVFIWSVRLGTYLYQRNVGKPEDARYAKLREDWGANANFKMLQFFYLQGLLNVVLAFPILLIMQNKLEDLHWVEYVGFGLWLIAIIGESLSDWQLARFKKNPENKGKICDVGFWHYSRHPNYFFEWMIWVSFFVMALGSTWGITAILSPILILHFLLNMTGIPATEEHMLRTRGKAFEDYKNTTSAFIPLPKRKNRA